MIKRRNPLQIAFLPNRILYSIRFFRRARKANRFIEGAKYYSLNVKIQIKMKDELNACSKAKVTPEDVAIVEEFYDIMMEILIKNLGEDILHYVETDVNLCMSIFVFGCIYGKENPTQTRLEIIENSTNLQQKTRSLVEATLYPSLENFDKYKDIYTQVLIQGIYFGQAQEED